LEITLLYFSIKGKTYHISPVLHAALGYVWDKPFHGLLRIVQLDDDIHMLERDTICSTSGASLARAATPTSTRTTTLL